MEKKLLEVEGDEMAIFSTKGIMAIIPKNKVNWVKKKLNEGCHECVDSLVQGLPNFDEDGQTAEDGVVLDTDPPPTAETDPPKRRDPNQKFYESETDPDTFVAQYSLPEIGVSAERQSPFRKALANLNPKNWFVDDYSQYNTKDEAYAAARQEGQKNFMYNGARYNTKMEGTPKQQMEWSGITDDQIHRGEEYKNKGLVAGALNLIPGVGSLASTAYRTLEAPVKEVMEERLSENLYPYGYQNMVERYKNAVLENRKSPNRIQMDESLSKSGDDGRINFSEQNHQNRMDAFRLYTGLPQKYNTFKVSDYTPGRSVDQNAVYYAINMDNPEFRDAMVERFNQITAKYDELKNTLGIDDKKAAELKEKYKLYPNEDYQNADQPIGMSNESRMTQMLRSPGALAPGEKYEVYEFLKDMGDNDLAEKFSPNNKTLNLTEKDSQKLSTYTRFTENIHDYAPKTRSVMWNDGMNMIMGNYNLSKGKDPDTGREYVSYRDVWDLSPMDLGKPFDIYDRIYLDELKKDKK